MIIYGLILLWYAKLGNLGIFAMVFKHLACLALISSQYGPVSWLIFHLQCCRISNSNFILFTSLSSPSKMLSFLQRYGISFFANCTPSEISWRVWSEILTPSISTSLGQIVRSIGMVSGCLAQGLPSRARTTSFSRWGIFKHSCRERRWL